MSWSFAGSNPASVPGSGTPPVAFTAPAGYQGFATEVTA